MRDLKIHAQKTKRREIQKTSLPGALPPPPLGLAFGLGLKTKDRPSSRGAWTRTGRLTAWSLGVFTHHVETIGGAVAWGCVTQMAATPTVQTVSRWAGWQGAALRGTLSPLPGHAPASCTGVAPCPPNPNPLLITRGGEKISSVGSLVR